MLPRALFVHIFMWRPLQNGEGRCDCGVGVMYFSKGYRYSRKNESSFSWRGIAV